jgi:hypothetical protein
MKKLALWHHCLDHVNHAMIINMHANGTVNGLNRASHALLSSPCEGCAAVKSARRPFPKYRSTPRATKPGLSFHLDVCGPMSQDSFGKSCYFVLFKDDFFWL